MRARDEQGTAVIEFVWLAILLLVPLLYVVLTVFETQRAAYAASAAARSAPAVRWASAAAPASAARRWVDCSAISAWNPWESRARSAAWALRC